MAVLGNGLNCAICLNRLGLIFTMIVVVRINLRFIVGMSMTFKKMVHPVGLGEAEKEQEKNSKDNRSAARHGRDSSRRRFHGCLTSIGDSLSDQPERREIECRCCRRNQNKISRTKKRAAAVNTMVAAEEISR